MRGELRRRGQQAATWLFIAPVHALLLGVIVIPACYVVWLSLTASTFGRTPVFVGIANYPQVLGDRYFWRALGNTIIVVLIVVHVELVAGLGMALLFASGLPCRRFLLAGSAGALCGQRGLGRGDVALLFDPGCRAAHHHAAGTGPARPRLDVRRRPTGC